MPQHLVVPVDVDDATLLKVAAFRAQNRLPHVVYQHPKTNVLETWRENSCLLQHGL